MYNRRKFMGLLFGSAVKVVAASAGVYVIGHFVSKQHGSIVAGAKDCLCTCADGFVAGMTPDPGICSIGCGLSGHIGMGSCL